MPTLAARLAVSVATASVALAGLEAWRARHPRAAGQPQSPDEAVAPPASEVPQLGANPVTAVEPPVAHKPASGGSLAMARIRGRVIGSAAALEKLDLVVQDETREYQPLVEDDGTFEIHLPVGSYTITATADNQIGVAEVLGLAADETRDVVLALGDGVAIRGRVEGCKGPCTQVSIQVQGPGAPREQEGIETDAKGEFAVESLLPGKSYELTFEAPGMRRLVLSGITAPRQGVLATLEPAASLAGGFGLAPGEKCPMESVELGSSDDDDGASANFDRACRFHFDKILVGGGSVHLSANGKGWHFELDVPIPAHGDPPFLCLHPTCREPEPEVKSTLEVLVTPSTSRYIRITVENPTEDETGSAGCESAAQPCVVEDLHPGRDVKVDVHAAGCEPRSYTLDIRPGKNFLASTCDGMREIHGVIRGASGESVVEHVRARCSSQHPPRRAYEGIVRLECPVRLSTIEYQLGADGSWLVAPITLSEDGSFGYVEITVP